MKLDEAKALASGLHSTYHEACLIVRSFGIEDTDYYGKVLSHSSPYTCVLESEFAAQFGDMSSSEMEARVKLVVE